MGKSNMPTSGSGLTDIPKLLIVKAALTNAWRADNDKPLKHMNAVIRAAADGLMLVSFGGPITRPPLAGESTKGAPKLNGKWRKALEADLQSRGIDPDQIIKSMGIDI